MARQFPVFPRILRLAAAIAVAVCACFPAPVSGIRRCSSCCENPFFKYSELQTGRNFHLVTDCPMARQFPVFPRILRLAAAIAVAVCACFPAPVSGIRPVGIFTWFPVFPRILRLAAAIAVAVCACFPAPVSGIRKDIGLVAPMMCRSTVQGQHLISDDNGYVCSALSFDPWSHCCPITGPRFSCQGCKFDLQCCNSYEYCVSCCLNPSKTKKEDVLKLKVAKPLTARTYTSVFDFCIERCRHSSTSVVHENAYASDFHHCFSVRQNSTGSSESNSVRFLGINVIVGRPGESCSLVCKAKGQSCVPSRLSALNRCEILQKYMRCKSGCFRSLGPDQPAEVVDEAPTSLNPGACLYMQKDERLTCDGSHQHTRRLCPCA